MTASFMRPLSPAPDADYKEQVPWASASGRSVLGQRRGSPPAPHLGARPLWASLEPGWVGAIPWQSPLKGLTLVSVLGSWVRPQGSAQLISSVPWCQVSRGCRQEVSSGPVPMF